MKHEDSVGFSSYRAKYHSYTDRRKWVEKVQQGLNRLATGFKMDYTFSIRVENYLIETQHYLRGKAHGFLEVSDTLGRIDWESIGLRVNELQSYHDPTQSPLGADPDKLCSKRDLLKQLGSVRQEISDIATKDKEAAEKTINAFIRALGKFLQPDREKMVRDIKLIEEKRTKAGLTNKDIWLKR